MLGGMIIALALSLFVLQSNGFISSPKASPPLSKKGRILVMAGVSEEPYYPSSLFEKLGINPGSSFDQIAREISKAKASITPDYLVDEVADATKGWLQQDEILLSGVSDFAHLKDTLWHYAELAAANPYTIPVVIAAVFLSGVAGVGEDDSKVGSPYSAGTTSYSVAVAENFYSARPYFVLRRLLKLASITGAFNMKLLLDWRFGNLEKNEKERAKEALVLSTQMGPTFIKLGQALSIRTDLIPEAYALELRQLQDAVPPFDTAVAKEIIREQLGVRDLSEVFSYISNVPVASASIGQVYRATLKDGRDVAVKVQRPKVLGEIALDLYLLRLITPLQVKISNAVNKVKTNQGDIDVAISLVDEWGRGFVAEVDYRLEALNTKQFSEAMVRKGLNAVTAPKVVDELCKSRVLVTEWMEGTRLDKDASPDVPRLCGVAVNAYLTMLLDTGVLHCDPHPGNLLRTKDGRLCILDWGMTLNVPRDLQYALLEFIAHINAEDYGAIPNDFVNLGFSPPDSLEKLKNSGITEGLSFAFRQLSKGGGPSKLRDRVKEEFKQRYGEDLSDEELRARARADMISQMEQRLKDEGVNVNGVTEVMEEMSKRNRELFKLPPYVLYVSRAFSTLEGIGLSVDEDYSILQECYPYLAKRLFSDDSPRSQKALRLMLFGAGAGSSGGVFSPEKLVEMSEGFASYTAATTDADKEGAGSEQAQKALADLLLAPEGNYVQDILLEEAAKVVDAAVRESAYRVRESPGGKLLTAALKAQRDLALAVTPPPLRFLALGATLPYELTHAVTKLIAKSEEDENSLRAAGAIWKSVEPRITGAVSKAAGAAVRGQSSSSSSSDAAAADKGAASTSGQKLPPFFPQSEVELSELARTIRKQLSDPAVRQQLPALNTLSRRFGATLLNRAAQRLTATTSNAVSASGYSSTGRKLRSSEMMSTPPAAVVVQVAQQQVDAVNESSSSTSTGSTGTGINNNNPGNPFAQSVADRAAAAGPGIESEISDALVEGYAALAVASAKTLAKAVAPKDSS